MVATNGAALRAMVLREKCVEILFQAATQAEPFAQLIRQVRLAERPVYRIDQRTSRIEMVTDGLCEADTDLITRCEKQIEQIHADALKALDRLVPPDETPANPVCEDGSSAHTDDSPRTSRFTMEVTERGFQKLH
jgi:hypothetical protein